MSSSSDLALAPAPRRTSVVRMPLGGDAASFPELPPADAPWQQDAPAGRWHDGYADGFAAGRQDAFVQTEAGLTHIDELTESLAAAVATARAHRVGALELAAVDVADAVVAIAEAVLARVLSDGEEVRIAIGRALSLAPAGATARVHVHPEDFDFVAPELLGEAAELVPDPTVLIGGCVLRVADLTIDGGLAAAVERARVALAGEASSW